MQHRRVVVDLASLIRGDGASGVSVKRLTAGLGRLKDVHDALRQGEAEYRWPHLLLADDATLGAVMELAAELRARGTELAVVGQPGALAAARVLTDTLAPGARVRWVGSPDEELLAPLDRPDVVWLVLEGPSWAARVAEWAVGQGRAVAVAGPEAGDAPPDGWWITDPTAGDGRFGALGMAALVVASWAGVDVGAALAGARDIAESCRRPALFENPAYSLAMSAFAIQQVTGLSVPTHLASTARLAAFTAWTARLWATVGAQYGARDGVRTYAGGTAIGGVLGDDELVQTLLAGTRDKYVILWEVEGPERGPAPSAMAAQARAFTQLWAREGLPLLRVRLPGLDAATLGGAIQLACHGAVTATLLAERDPLGLEAVEAWYGAVERAAADVDEGSGTA